MYSIVLMAALTAGAETPTWCHGCRGCCGGWGCHGCYSYCHGCHGCYGCGCYGCYGCGCYAYGHGCYGCYGGCYGCYGGCCGCYSGWGCCGGCYGYGYGAPVMVAPGAPAGAVEPVPAPKKDMKIEKKDGEAAKLIIEVPADAKLFIDDQPMKTTSARRVFSTPTLQPGQTYYYIVRAEVVRDGQTISDTKRVTLKAGDVIRAGFAGLGATDPNKAVAAVAK